MNNPGTPQQIRRVMTLKEAANLNDLALVHGEQARNIAILLTHVDEATSIAIQQATIRLRILHRLYGQTALDEVERLTAQDLSPETAIEQLRRLQ
jgi:hypothetical protein